MIRITSPRANFRRAGIAHPQGVTVYPDDTFTSEQLKALKNEPMLAVEVVAEANADEGDGDKKQPVKEKDAGKDGTSEKQAGKKEESAGNDGDNKKKSAKKEAKE